MKRFLFRLGLVLSLSLCVFSAAWAANPEDALSARPEDSVYFALRVDNLGDFLRWAVSERNLRTFAPLAELDEDSIKAITAILDKVPVKAAALAVGMTKEGAPFFQAALAGEGTNATELLLGADSPMAEMAESTLKDSGLAFEVKDGLLLLGATPDDLKAGAEALEDEGKRLSIQRRFAAKDFALFHVDFTALKPIAMMSAEDDEARKSLEENYKVLEDYFRAPFEVELDVESFADRCLISGATNVMEALNKKYAAEMAEARPVPGGHIRLLGEGSPLFALGTCLNLESFKRHPALKEAIEQGVAMLKQTGISEKDFTHLLSGGLSLVLGGGSFQYEGIKIPSLCLTQTGEDGAAASILGVLGGMEDLHLNPVQTEGWDKMLQVDSSVSPVPCLLGVQGETLLLGLTDAASLTAAPAPAPKLAELLGKDALAALYMDFAGIQSHLKSLGELIAGFMPLVGEVTGQDSLSQAGNLVSELLNAKLSIPSFSLWGATAETFFMEFALADVPAGEGLWDKMVKVGLAVQKMAESGEEKKD